MLGGGHVALPVVEFGAKIGFLVTVVDDRLSFANPGRFPLAEQVVCDQFFTRHRAAGDHGERLRLHPHAGHRYDADCLRQICRERSRPIWA